MDSKTHKGGFIKLNRSPEALELARDPNAFTLLAIIAMRARRNSEFNFHNLKHGEALIGDYKNYGLTEQKYRTAKKKLKNWKFITTRTTNRGTIAKLINSAIWDINIQKGNEPPNSQATGKQRTGND